jgi:hypothetical protein
MGYLNNSSRTLDAILTKKGREILSTGGDFNVAKFALGDDEIDYGLWDTTHTKGTDFYGAVIDNLPTLEPFNDPSEIMKYKLVSRSDGVQAMAKLIELQDSVRQLKSLKWYALDEAGAGGTRVQVGNTNTFLGVPVQFGVGHVDNHELTVDYSGGPDSIYSNGYAGERFTLTLLDTTQVVLAPLWVDPAQVASQQIQEILGAQGPGAFGKGKGKGAPNANTSSESQYLNIPVPNNGTTGLWYPFVHSVQHLSQTISDCVVSNGTFAHANAQFAPTQSGRIALYPKRLTSNSSPAKTTLVVTGQTSGAVKEFDVKITFRSTSYTPSLDIDAGTDTSLDTFTG